MAIRTAARVLSVLAVGVAVAVAGAGPVQAAWTPPTTLGPSGGTPGGAIEPAPRAAIGADGTVLGTWVRSVSNGNIVHGTIGDDRGRFTAAQRLGAGLRPAVAVAATGAGLVVFEGTGGLRVAVRRPGARRFAPARVLVAAPANGAEDGFPLVAIDSRGTALAVYEHSFRGRKGYRTYLRAVRVDVRTGRAVGPTADLGLASLPRGATLEPGPGGGLSLLIATAVQGDFGVESGPPQVLTWAPGAPGATRLAPAAPAGFEEGVLRGDGRGSLALAGVDATISGDAGAAGHPVAAAIGGNPPALSVPFAGPQVTSPNRSFGAVATPVPGGGVAMVYQQKDRPEGFSRAAPILATAISPTGTVGKAVRLSGRKGSEPQVVTAGAGAVAVWDDAGRLGAARRTGARWRRIGAPRGAVVPFHDYVTNRQLVAGGSTAVLVWEGGRSIRLSVLRP
jgi:hypothetical protein